MRPFPSGWSSQKDNIPWRSPLLTDLDFHSILAEVMETMEEGGGPEESTRTSVFMMPRQRSIQHLVYPPRSFESIVYVSWIHLCLRIGCHQIFLTRDRVGDLASCIGESPFILAHGMSKPLPPPCLMPMASRIHPPAAARSAITANPPGRMNPKATARLPHRRSRGPQRPPSPRLPGLPPRRQRSSPPRRTTDPSPDH